MAALTYSITIEAPPDIVFANLTTSDGLMRWMGTTATADPRPDGDLTWTHENGATMIGRFVELDPPRRVVFRYGWQDDLMGVPPSSTIVTIDLIDLGGATRVELTHDGLPDDVVPDHRIGWEHFLGVLSRVTDGTDDP